MKFVNSYNPNSHWEDSSYHLWTVGDYSKRWLLILTMVVIGPLLAFAAKVLM